MQTNNFASALAKAQSEMLIAPKNGYNPHYKSYFSTFEDLIEVSRPALTKYGLSLCQYLQSDNEHTSLVTKLKHESGQEEVSTVRINLKDPSDIQKLGSALSYLKRYAYAAMCGIATSESEDDGNSVTIEPKMNDFVSPKQLGLLKAKIGTQYELEKKLCSHYKIDSLDHLPWKKMNEVMDILTNIATKQTNSI